MSEMQDVARVVVPIVLVLVGFAVVFAIGFMVAMDPKDRRRRRVPDMPNVPPPPKRVFNEGIWEYRGDRRLLEATGGEPGAREYYYTCRCCGTLRITSNSANAEI